jgi:hypothetical protein
VADSELATRSGFAVNRMHPLEEATHQSGSERRKLEMLGGTPVAVSGDSESINSTKKDPSGSYNHKSKRCGFVRRSVGFVC